MDEKINNLPPTEGYDENNIEIFEANLITNYELTLEFMKAIEGPGWLEDQENMGSAKNTFKYITEWLKTADKNGLGEILYGWGGGDRYLIRPDGSVAFLSHFATERTLRRAKNLNFPIEK
jgi:hypothetical protein